MSGNNSWSAMLKKSLLDFWNNDSLSSAGGLAYSTIFSLPAVLVLILMVVGMFVSPAEIQEALESQLGGLVGPDGRDQISSILSNAQRPDISLGAASAIGILFLLIGATGALVQLQSALNKAWEVKPDPNQGGLLRNFLMKRVLSLGMVMGIAFLLLASLVVSAALSAVGAYVGTLFGGVGPWILELFNNLLSFAVITVMFAAMFKFLPDAEMEWRDVWVGAAATTVLFILGKFLIGLYIGRSSLGEPFGAAASLAVLLVWIYYASLIVLLGAEFTETWAKHRGSGVRPEPGAVGVVEEERVVAGPGATVGGPGASPAAG